MRRLLALGIVLVATVATASAATGSAAYPKIIPLPTGFQPEGIAVGRGHEVFAGGLLSGAIWKGDLRSGGGDVLVAGGQGRMSVGMYVDDRSGHLFVAGGLTGASYVYDGGTGADVAVLGMPGGFLNDVIVTERAAYFTDSFSPTLYRVPLGPGGAVAGTAALLPLGGDWVQEAPGTFNANGIEASSDGRWLIVVNSTTGLLYRVDPETGDAAEIDLGGDTLAAGDGLRRVGFTLYVVQNTLNKIAVVELARDLSSGSVVREITDSGFRVPTTAAVFGSSLYAINARFDVAPPTGGPAPTVEFEIVRVPRH
jgi:sugar lactone lactonase YvrE